MVSRKIKKKAPQGKLGGRIRMKCSFPKIPAVQETYLQQSFRYKGDESSKSADILGCSMRSPPDNIVMQID
jgi:hypothetical protein